MKKYLSIAAILGIIAFASVAFLAQAGAPAARAAQKTASVTKTPVRLASAEPANADPSDGEAAADAAEAEDAKLAPAVTPAPKADADKAGAAAVDQAGGKDAIAPKPIDAFTADHDTCAASATATKGTDGLAATTDQIADAYNKCMNDKGHSAEELKAHAMANEGEEDTGNGKSGDE